MHLEKKAFHSLKISIFLPMLAHRHPFGVSLVVIIIPMIFIPTIDYRPQKFRDKRAESAQHEKKEAVAVKSDSQLDFSTMEDRNGDAEGAGNGGISIVNGRQVYVSTDGSSIFDSRKRKRQGQGDCGGFS